MTTTARPRPATATDHLAPRPLPPAPTPSVVNGLPEAARARYDQLHALLERLPADAFAFPADMATGDWADRYFPRTADSLADHGKDQIVTMQVFARAHGVLAGIPEVIRMLETALAANTATGRAYSLRDFQIETLVDGDPITPGEPVMHIRGPYLAFAHLETAYLGVLADRTLVASNTRRAVEAAAGRPIIFMAARHTDWRRQPGDGYAAMVGGATAVTTTRQASWWPGAVVAGTMPHAKIACARGEVVTATFEYIRSARQRGWTGPVVALVDYHNDCVRDAVRVADAVRASFGPGVLTGVRLDTSGTLVDRSLTARAAAEPARKWTGVQPELVQAVRTALDAAGHPAVQITVSGGFTPARIRQFVAAGVPVDTIGIGSSLLGHNRGAEDGLLTSFDFTADIVAVDGNAESKVGRDRRDNARFVTLDIPRLLGPR